MMRTKKFLVKKSFCLNLLSWGLFTFATLHSLNASQLKPRLVVLAGIAPCDIEPDDQQSIVRYLAYADQFEIEALIVAIRGNRRS